MGKVVVVFGDVQKEHARASCVRGDRRGDAEIVRLWGPCPWTEQASDYDRANINLYARLLHDESEGASEAELGYFVFGFTCPTQRSRLVVRSHLDRAHWIADTLFPLLGW